MNFHLESEYSPSGDQPAAIDQLVDALSRGVSDVTLLGVTGSGKTFTMANVIERLQRPALILSHNKTLAAQLYGEFKSFFPGNAVEYFVSYYDYYQPEAYLPVTDTYIEKDLSINDQIDKLRLSAASALMSGRRDVIVISSVSCLYGIGNPDDFHSQTIEVLRGENRSLTGLLYKLVDALYSRTETDFKRGTFRVHGDTVDVFLGGADEDDHYLAAGKTAFHQHMPEKTGVIVFIVYLDFEIRQQLSDIGDDAVGNPVFNHAAVYSDDSVAVGLVHTGNDLPARGSAKCSLNLVAVVRRVFHADNRLDFCKFVQQNALVFLLPGQLLLIGHVLQLAAAALFCIRALCALRVIQNSRSGSCFRNLAYRFNRCPRKAEFIPRPSTGGVEGIIHCLPCFWMRKTQAAGPERGFTPVLSCTVFPVSGKRHSPGGKLCTDLMCPSCEEVYFYKAEPILLRKHLVFQSCLAYSFTHALYNIRLVFSCIPEKKVLHTSFILFRSAVNDSQIFLAKSVFRNLPAEFGSCILIACVYHQPANDHVQPVNCPYVCFLIA